MDKRNRPKTISLDPALRAYVVGVALGDGNLSNPNGRAVRLRITCDTAYLRLIESICAALRKLLPENKISVHNQKGNCVYVSCYSDHWEKLLGWRASGGSKAKQKIRVPHWVMNRRNTMISCLKGLVETDGPVYFDRGYQMVNFTSNVKYLINDVYSLFSELGYQPNLYSRRIRTGTKYTIRLSKNVPDFLAEFKPLKQ